MKVNHPVTLKVTRLGDVSPNGWLFTLGKIFETQIWATFFHSLGYALLSTKMQSGLYFSQAHLVTLLVKAFHWQEETGRQSCLFNVKGKESSEPLRLSGRVMRKQTIIRRSRVCFPSARATFNKVVYCHIFSPCI
jgi:hypothetical protein